MQRAAIQQAQQVDGICAFTGIIGLPGDDTGREDDQRFRVLRDIGQDAARLGLSFLHPVAWT